MIEGVKILNLPKLVELKLASGMSGAARLKDLADVQDNRRNGFVGTGRAVAVELAFVFVEEFYPELGQ